MNVESLIFLGVCTVSIAMWAVFLCLTRDITFFSKSTDNQKQIAAAGTIDLWKWPSDMHKYSGEKSRMKDVLVICLALFQKAFRDKTTDYPLIALCGLSNALSGILLFYIAWQLWGVFCAVSVFVLFIFCIWPWQIALMGGHICLGHCLFLLALTPLVSGAVVSPLWLYALSGAIFAMVQFSSASARKFIPFFLAGLLYSQRHYFDPGLAGIQLNKSCGYLICLAAGFIAPAVFFVCRYKDTKKHRTTASMAVVAAIAAVLLYFCCLFFKLNSFLPAVLMCAAGFMVVVLFLFLPDIPVNLKGYMGYFFIAEKYCHFILYRDYFKKRGRPIPDNFRGIGWLWVVRYFWRVIPFIFALYIVAVISLAIKPGGFLTMGLVILSLMPLLWAEWTGALQLGRVYFPQLSGMLFIIGVAAVSLPENFWHWAAIYLSIFAIWNLVIFLFDVWPARMAPVWLLSYLECMSPRIVYTYQTPFNDTFFYLIHDRVKQKFDLRFIRNLKDIVDCENAVLIVPPQSSKSLAMESREEGFMGEDFRADKTLNNLIDGRTIRQYASVCLKTFGTSRIWVHESEVSSYRDLILKEIKEEDRFRGYGWIIDERGLKAVLRKEAA